MVETDWREILSFSQRELGQKDKEKLCESLSWMEADDIELNFTDLKTLFRLAQDILKYKNEQVNGLMGKLESANKKTAKGKSKRQQMGSPASTDSVLETIAHQEEVIKANKEILKQLYLDIAELEGRKSKIEGDRSRLQGDSDSSRDALSEMDAVVQLENEVSMKNRHIRKLLSDVNALEDENTNLKEKVSVLKDKLLEATHLIDNLTEQILCVNNECSQLKEILGRKEKEKVQFSCEIESLRKKLIEVESGRENIYEEIRSKVQHWKNIARVKKAELEELSLENEKLKENLNQVSKKILSPKAAARDKSQVEQQKIKELQEKLIEASNEMEQSANLISILKAENRQLKNVIEDTTDHTITEARNESDDGKQRLLINKLKKKVKSLTVTLKGTEEMVAIRERELAEIATELQLLQSDEGISTLLKGLKHKKQELKIKDEGIKSLVQEVNNMSQLVNELQLENETLRQKYNVPSEEIISTDRIVKKYRNLEQNNDELCKELRRLENKLVNVELMNRNLNIQYATLTKLLNSLGYDKHKIEQILQADNNSNDMPLDGGGESSTIIGKQSREFIVQEHMNDEDAEIKRLAEENEGLRKGLQEIFDFLKDNSTTSSGILALQCPSLEAMLRSMEARHAAGWFAPHMSTILELRAALGGKDALLTALHDARKETFDIMNALSKETKKSSELERKVHELETIHKQNESDTSTQPTKSFEFGSWMSENYQNNIDLNNKSDIEEIIEKGNDIYETQLKMSLEYFHRKFKALYDKMTSMAIQAADDSNKWSIQEEQYKAQIESLKGQIRQHNDEDISDHSQGLISIPSTIHLQRKCTYLEESYRFIRTLNENIKNENMDDKRQMMTTCSEYEAEIQRLILAIANLTDKLRSSIPVELFWKQNFAYNEIVLKYRRVLEAGIHIKNESADLAQRLERDKLDIICRFQQQISPKAKKEQDATVNVMSNIEESVLKKQLEGLCKEIDMKSKKIAFLENRNADLQAIQSTIIDKSLASITKEEEELIKTQLKHLSDENKILKKQCKHVGSQLDIALLQLQEHQQRQMSNDMEINLLRHQILDLQSNSDNKAIVARLSGEVLVAHLQASESNKKIERLNSTLAKEKELRVEAEEMFKARQKIFDVYSFRYESKFRYMFEVMQVLRQQYQGSVPLLSIENYLNAVEDIGRETRVLHEKLQDIEDLRSNLMAKHSIFDQILDVSKTNCPIDQNTCSHKLNAIVAESLHSRELEHVKKKLQTLEQSREDLTKNCNRLEKTLILVNQGFEKPSFNGVAERKQSIGEINPSLELEDVQSDDETSGRKSQTITLPKPQVLKKLKSTNGERNKQTTKENCIGSPLKTATRTDVSSVLIQTVSIEQQTNSVSTQTIDDKESIQLKNKVEFLIKEKEKSDKELNEALSVIDQKNKENLTLNTENINLEASIQNLKTNCKYKDNVIERMRSDIDDLRNELSNVRSLQSTEFNKEKKSINTDTNSLLQTLKQLENDKNLIAAEYKELLKNEREEYSKNVKELNLKINEMKSKMDRKEAVSNDPKNDDVKEIINDYTVKIIQLEDKSFKFHSELDECKSEVAKYKCEVDRWKELASERLARMEQINSQLEEKHCNEIESYKAENEHWMTQLSATIHEHTELRSQIMQQKTMYLQQLADKDALIKRLRLSIKNLKGRSASTSEVGSDHGSDKLEIKYDSSGDNISEGSVKIDCPTKCAWNQPGIEKLHHDKQLMGKQNEFLRHQVKALTAKERKSRLDAQNLKKQVNRIRSNSRNRRKLSPDIQTLKKTIAHLEAQLLSARSKAQSRSSASLRNRQKSGSTTKVTPEVSSLRRQVKNLEAHLESARRDQQLHIDRWDKYKRAQKTAERWQARFEEKCKEVQKLEASVKSARTAISRLEKEKRILIHRITERREKQDPPTPKITKNHSTECGDCSIERPSHRALLDRVEAQQRKIVALQLAEKGNEHLVSAHEKALAEITSLRGQVLKLESTLLEAQIRSPLNSSSRDPQPELEYWKCYCDMLKQENVQLTHRVSSLDSVPNTANQNRVNDLEQTILTLRGLVSKLQAELKVANASQKRTDSRPNSGRSSTEKTISKLESSHRTEIANLKKTIQDKDLLLERSKEMLKIAAEREDELLRENSMLRRELDELKRDQKGYVSA